MSLTDDTWRRVCTAKDAELARLRAENERLVALLDERLPNWRTYR